MFSNVTGPHISSEKRDKAHWRGWLCLHRCSSIMSTTFSLLYVWVSAEVSSMMIADLWQQWPITIHMGVDGEDDHRFPPSPTYQILFSHHDFSAKVPPAHFFIIEISGNLRFLLLSKPIFNLNFFNGKDVQSANPKFSPESALWVSSLIAIATAPMWRRERLPTEN